MNVNSIHTCCPTEVVAQLRDVSLDLADPHDVGMAGVSLTVKQGDLVLLLLEEGRWNHPLADVLSGLLPVEQGDVEVFGENWKQRSPDRQARCRGRIGRVFERHGWLSNLDVDENVTLSERHHTTRPLEAIYQEARDMAMLAGMEELPTARPALVGREILRRAEWVRAALGPPWLLLLERPGRDLAKGWRADCSRLVARLRQQGTAVLWMCEDEGEWDDQEINPSLKLKAEGNTLRTGT